MNRGILGLIILVLFLAAGLWSAGAMVDFHDPLSQDLQQAADMALAGNLPEAAAKTRLLRQKWDSHWGKVAILADHTPMDEIDSLFSRVEAYGKAGNASDFAACCNQLSTLISATAEAHTLTWRNLL